MKRFTKILMTLVVLVSMSTIQSLAGVGTVTVKLLASDGITGVPGATVKYYKGGEQTLGVTDANGEFSQLISDIAGTTTFYLLPANGGRRIWLSVDPATNPMLTAQMVAVTINLKSSTGTPLAGTAKYYKDGWQTLGTTPVTVDLLPFTGLVAGQGAYDFQIQYNGRTAPTQRIDVSTVQTINFSTTRVHFAFSGPVQYYNGGWQTINGPIEMLGGTQNYAPFTASKAEFRFGSPVVYQKYFDITGTSLTGGLFKMIDENGAALANFNLGSMQTFKYRCGGSWGPTASFATDANGYYFASINCPANNWDKKVTLSVNKTAKEQDLTVNSTFQVAVVTVNLKTCAGAPIAGAKVEQGSGSWTPRGTTDANGQNSYYAFPGNDVVARLSYNYGSQTISGVPVVLPVTNIDFTTTKVTLNGAAPIAIQVGGWPTVTFPMEMLPGTYGFRFNGKLISGVVVSGCEFSRTLLQVKNESNGPVAGATFVPACGGSWQPQLAGATDANGCLFAEVPACMTKIKANVGSSSQELTAAQLATSGYTYTTQVLRINFINAAGTPITDGLGTIQSGGGWPTIGSFNASGYFDVNSFPATTGFRATYNNTTEQKNFTIVAGAGIQQETFQTGQVFGACITQYAGAGWSTFVDGMELMPGTRNFRYPTQSGTVVAGAITNLTCPSPTKTDFEAGTAFIAYPNPATETVSFLNFEGNFEVYNTTGQLMYSGNAATINIADWQSGLYVVRTQDQVIKFVKK
jgi:hypothetical protein